MEVCQFLPKFKKIIYLGQIYGIMLSFAKICVKCQKFYFFQKQLLLNLFNKTNMVFPINPI
jgi:hypothetical protein